MSVTRTVSPVHMPAAGSSAPQWRGGSVFLGVAFFALGLGVAVAGSFMTGAVKEKAFTTLVGKAPGMTGGTEAGLAGAGHDHGGEPASHDGGRPNGAGRARGEGYGGAKKLGKAEKGDKEVLIVDLGKQGPVKRLFQPWVQRISVSVKNELREARRLAVAVEGCDGLRWRSHVYDVNWDAAASAFRTPVPAGKSFTVSLVTSIPESLRERPVVCRGRIEARDADDGRVLVSAPLEILNSRAGVPALVRAGVPGLTGERPPQAP